MDQQTNRQWLLEKRPVGMITGDEFRLAESPVPAPADGEVLVRNLYLSCDPTQRGWMAYDTYLPAIKLGEVIRSFAVGQVVESKNPKFHEGQLVQGLFGWQEYALAKPGSGSSPGRLPEGVAIETAMSLFGMTGLTAYFGLLEVGRPKEGETVLVSGAAGATGSVVGQLAKIKGCRAIGVAGGKDKCDLLLSEFGFDAAIDYKREDLNARLKELCPKGIDVFFDNVGGEVLDAALARLARNGRIVLCGAISGYSAEKQPPGPKNYSNLIVQRGRMEGFIILDFLPRAAEGVAALQGWHKEGKLKDRVDVVRGFENAPRALQRLFKGENQGKQLVQVAEPQAIR